MIKIKITSIDSITDQSAAWRQLPGGKGIVDGKYQFYLNDPTVKECDYWFVWENYGLPRDSMAICPKENVYFIMGEAEGVHVYHPSFIKQFHNLITVQRNKYDVPKTYYRYMTGWMLGDVFDESGLNTDHCKTYDELKSMGKIPKKKLLSVISSNKAFSEGHRKRLDFVKKLKAHFGDELDVFGRGIRSFPDKWDVIAPYKYHIALENQSVQDYFTEKLIDTYLAQAYPIYYGCPNVMDYFPEKSLSTIDINDPKRAIEIIEDAINDNLYEKNFNQLKIAANLVLDKYNPYFEMIEFIKKNNYSTEPVEIRLRPENYFVQVDRYVQVLHAIKNAIETEAWDEARRILEENQKYYRENIDFLYLQSLFYKKTGLIAKAIAGFKKAAELQPGNEKIRTELQQCYKIQAEKEENVYPSVTIIDTDALSAIDYGDGKDMYQNRKKMHDLWRAESDPLVSISFLAYNNLEEYTKPAIESLIQYTEGIDFELILIDNGSTDGTLEYFKSVPVKNKRIYRITKNIGASEGMMSAFMNAGRRFYRGKYIVQLPNDILLTTNWLKNMVACIESDEKIGFVVPMSDGASNNQQVDLQYTDFDDMQRKAALFNTPDPNKWEERMRAIPCPICMLRAELQNIFHYDTAFIYYFLDDDQSFTFRRMGYKVMVCGDVFIHHEGTTSMNRQQALDNFSKGAEMFKRKYFGIDSWKDTTNFEWAMRDAILEGAVRKEKNTVLGVDVRCGTPLLDIKNGLKKFGMKKVELSAYTQDAKYWTDLQTICGGEVVCGDIDRIHRKLSNHRYDYIIVGEYIEDYAMPEELLLDLREHLNDSGRLVCKYRAYEDIGNPHVLFSLMKDEQFRQKDRTERWKTNLEKHAFKGKIQLAELSQDQMAYQEGFFSQLEKQGIYFDYEQDTKILTKEKFRFIVADRILVIWK